MKVNSSVPAVVLQQLRFGYTGPRRSLAALQPKLSQSTDILDIDAIKIAAASHTLISGESGCGKSTLLNLISGILTGASGKLEVLGTELSRLSGSERDRFRAQNIAVIFQQFNLIPYLTVQQNILLGLKLSGRHIDSQRISSLLSHLQIRGFADEKAAALSYGQQQRVAAARALANQSPLIIADEPTSALDDKNARLFLDLLFAEAAVNKTTIIVVSHDVRYKKRFDNMIDLAKINRAAQGHAL